jgi:N-methylhydantoinase B/oxoprolinase/acetone carboxylase alpha subunit
VPTDTTEIFQEGLRLPPLKFYEHGVLNHTLHAILQPWGLAGGQPAASVQAWVERAEGSIEEIPSKRVFTLRKGESLHVDTPGGGGYGDPLERAPEAVRRPPNVSA